jgi:hypothetical protein
VTFPPFVPSDIDFGGDLDGAVFDLGDITVETPTIDSTAPADTTVLVASSPPGVQTPNSGGGGGGRVQGLPLSSLPMALPDDGTNTFQKLGTLLLGGALFLGLRRFLAWHRLRAI